MYNTGSLILTCYKDLIDRHVTGRQRSRLVTANGCHVPHRLTRVKISDQNVVRHHVLTITLY